MQYDGRSNFGYVLDFVKTVFKWYVDTMDSIFILGNFSMLDFSIALLIMGALLPLLIKTVASNYSNVGSYRSPSFYRLSRKSEKEQGLVPYNHNQSLMK